MPRVQHVCIACSSQIQQPHTALRCEGCNRRQHLKCGTGISQSFYWMVTKSLGVFEWYCAECSSPTMARAKPICMACSSQIQQPHTALRCEECNGRQHLKCGTGISQDFYWMVVRCLGVFEWSCSACSTSTQSEGNETSQISPQPKRRCSCLDDDGRPTIPAKRQRTDPVSSQTISPIPSRPAAPVSSQSTAPVLSRPAAPVSSQSTAPVPSQTAAPVFSWSTAQVSSRFATPVSSQPAAPVSSRSTAPESDLDQHHPGDPVCITGADSDRNPDNSAADLPTEKHPKDPVTYEILEKGSSQGKPLLVSSDGYDFRLQIHRDFIKRWVCYNNSTCSAAVNQRGDSFQPSQHEHNHPSQPYIKLKRQMVAEAKEMALSDINRSADSIAREICFRVPEEVLNVVPKNNLRQMVYATRRKDLKARGKN